MDMTLFKVCGDTLVWKPAPSTPLTAVAVTKIVSKVLEECNVPGSVASLCVGGADVGKLMSQDTRIKLLSFTGSTAVGHQVRI